MKIYGLTEVAQALGVSPNVVRQWHKRGKLPEPTARLSAGSVWVAKDIEPWIKTMRGAVPCESCGALIPPGLEIPDVDDEVGWSNMLSMHWRGCAWVSTRAHQRPAR